MKTNLGTSTQHAASDFETIAGEELSRVGGGWSGGGGYGGGWSGNTGRHRGGWDDGCLPGRGGCSGSRSCGDRDPFPRW